VLLIVSKHQSLSSSEQTVVVPPFHFRSHAWCKRVVVFFSLCFVMHQNFSEVRVHNTNSWGTSHGSLIYACTGLKWGLARSSGKIWVKEVGDQYPGGLGSVNISPIYLSPSKSSATLNKKGEDRWPVSSWGVILMTLIHWLGHGWGYLKLCWWIEYNCVYTNNKSSPRECF